MDIANESRVYARALYPLGHGCALWIPEPNDALSEPYRETGVRIGDVGILTPDGGFDFIFNTCCSADDPINQYGVPEGFQSLPWDGRRFERANRFRPGIPLCSRDTKQWDLSVRGVASLPGLPAGAGGGIGIQFCRDRGAVLMPPKGASRVDCHNLSLFREYAERHYANWYQFLNGTLGREAENGAIYFITGFDKTDCWENAVVCTTFNTKDGDFCWDQFNGCTFVQTRGKKTKVGRGLPELSKFTEIKRGDIFKDKDVFYSWSLCSNGKDDMEAAVYIA